MPLGKTVIVMQPPMRAWQRIKLLAPILWLTIAAVAAYVIAQRLSEIDPAQVLAQLRDETASATLLLAVALIATYWLMVGLYEVIMVNAIGRALPWWRACAVVWTANPIGHAVGFTLFSAGALRYRLYRPLGLSVRQVGGVIAMSPLPWILGLSWLLDMTLVIEADIAATALHLSPTLVATLGGIGLAKDAGYLAFVARRKTPVTLGGLEVPWPSLQATLLQLAIGIIEVLLLAGTIYVLMPTELSIGFVGFIPVYLIALIVAKMSNVPAGLGVLEASLLLMLPEVPTNKLLGAVLAYRVIFELLPLLVAMALLAIYEGGSRHGIAGRWWRVRAGVTDANRREVEESRSK